MGSVWEGVHATLGSRVACKFIDPQFVESSDALARFENEARAAASLNSKHVVDVYDHGLLEDGRPYIVMEYLVGESLDARMVRLGVLPLQAVATIVRQISLALVRAHAKGIIHRDLKPENIFLVWDEEDQADLVKVVDFGIAKFTNAKASGISSATKTGSVLGTPYYMSPEQARGLKDIDARSDIWSLGVISYQALTGHIPFDGEAIGDLLVKLCTIDPTPPTELNPTLPPAVDQWMARALNREPELRFQDAREMAEALLTLAELPQRTTLGSTVGRALDETALQFPKDGTKGKRTQPQGSPKSTTAGFTRSNDTHSGLETSQTKAKSALIWLFFGVALVGIAAGATLLSGQGTRDDESTQPKTTEVENNPSVPSVAGAPKSVASVDSTAVVQDEEKPGSPPAAPVSVPTAPDNSSSGQNASPKPPVKRPARAVIVPAPSAQEIAREPKTTTAAAPEAGAATAPRAPSIPRPAPAPKPQTVDLGY